MFKLLSLKRNIILFSLWSSIVATCLIGVSFTDCAKQPIKKRPYKNLRKPKDGSSDYESDAEREARKEEAEKEEARKAEARKEEAEKEEARKAEARKAEAEKEEARKAEARKAEAEKEEARKAEARKAEAKKNQKKAELESIKRRDKTLAYDAKAKYHLINQRKKESDGQSDSTEGSADEESDNNAKKGY